MVTVSSLLVRVDGRAEPVLRTVLITLPKHPSVVRRSAQFEHSVVVTKDGIDILTKRLDSSPPLWWEV